MHVLDITDTITTEMEGDSLVERSLRFYACFEKQRIKTIRCHQKSQRKLTKIYCTQNNINDYNKGAIIVFIWQISNLLGK